MNIKKTKGLLAATFSTFSENGDLDIELISQVVEKLISNGVTGVFVGGTNGEGLNMTLEERMKITEAYIKAADKRILVFIHVGHNSIREAKKLAAHAQSCGADAISSAATFYFKPSSAQVLANCMAEIAAAAPGLPFYYYHMPAATGVHINVLEFLKLAEKQIPNLAGVKYTANTLHEYQSCLEYANHKFDVLFGYDELLLSALAVGAKGAIGSTYTFAAPIYTEIIKAFENKDLDRARQLQSLAIQMISCLPKYGSIPAQKAILSLLGTDLGPCRLPLVTLKDAEKTAIKEFLQSFGFFEKLEALSQEKVESEI
ncbi:MAG: N-acetylneuraminate lyase [Sphingobacteriales bacterium 41-5]|nr:MAG: N-acetylneuraminate lyase [Sphingobacteriales bacterium 41-5]